MGGDISAALQVMQKEMEDAKTSTAYTPPTSEAQDFKGIDFGAGGNTLSAPSPPAGAR